MRLQSKEPVIGLVVSSFDKGGLEQIVFNLYKGYQRKGIKAYILCQKNDAGSLAENIAEGDFLLFHEDEAQFVHFLQQYHISVLHYHYNTFMMDQIGRLNIRSIYTMHNAYTWMKPREFIRYTKKLRHADRIIPVSNYVQDYFCRRAAPRKFTTQVIYNGIDASDLDERAVHPGATREALGFRDDDFVMVFVASFHPIKAQIGMIGVMERMIQQDQHIKLVLVGNIGDSDYYQRFQDACGASPAKQWIKVLPYFDHRHMGAFLRETADISILPTLQEGCSNAVLEAMYCGVPMILTDVGNAQQAERLTGCLIVPPPYRNIFAMRNRRIIATAQKKHMINQDAWVQAILKMRHDLPAYRQKAMLSPEKKNEICAEHMIDAYTRIARDLVAESVPNDHAAFE